MDNATTGFAAMVVLLLAILYAAYIAIKRVLSRSKGNKPSNEKVPNRKIVASWVNNTLLMNISTIAMLTCITTSAVFIILVDNNIGGKLSENILTVSNIGMYVCVIPVSLALLGYPMGFTEEDVRRWREQDSIRDNVPLSFLLAILFGIFFTSLVVSGVGVYGLYFQGMSGEAVFYALFAGIVSMISAQLLRNKGIALN